MTVQRSLQTQTRGLQEWWICPVSWSWWWLQNRQHLSKPTGLYTRKNEFYLGKLYTYWWRVCVCAVCSLAQSYPALCDPMDCIAHQAPLSMGFPKQEYWSGLLFPSPGDLPHPGIEPRSPTLQEDSLPAEPPGKPKNTGVGSLPLLQGSSQPRNRTGVSCITGGFFTNWATREACSIGRFFTVWATRKVHIDDVIIYSSINTLYLHEPNMTILRKSL